MTAHAKLSPSSAHRWLTCPASSLMEADKPNDSNEYAAEGTTAHFLAEICLQQRQPAADYNGGGILVTEKGECSLLKSAGEPIGAYKYHFEITPLLMTSYVQEYIDTVQSVQQSTGGVLDIEQRLPLTPITGEADAYGTADVVIVADDELIVIDLKYGQGNRIDADNNPQLMLYGLAAVLQYQMLGDFQQVRLIVCQPRLNHVSEWSIRTDKLKAWGKSVSHTAKLIHTLDVDSDLTGLFAPSQDACKYCKAKTECKPYAEFVHQRVSDEFASLDAPLCVSDAKYDSDTLAVMYSRIKLIQDWCKSVETAVYDHLLNGNPVAGYKLVEGRAGARKWTDDTAAEETLKTMRLKVDDMYDKKLISPTTAEKLHKAGTLGDIQWGKLQDIIVKPEGKPSIAPKSDKHPALNFNVADEFDDITQA